MEKEPTEDLRLNPEERMCPIFDRYSIKMFRQPEHMMGFRVVDNCAEEHMM